MPAFSVSANLAFDSYGKLIEAISDWMDRSDLNGSAPAMIALAESRLRRELEPYFAETTASVAVTDGVGAFPADFSTLICVRDGTRRTLTQIAPSAALNILPCPFAEAYTIEEGQLRSWPPTSGTLTLVYRPTLPQLSDANSTNAILDKFPDVYFFGTMLFAEGYVANDNRAAVFKGLFEEALDEVKRYLTRQSFGGPLVPRLAFVP